MLRIYENAVEFQVVHYVSIVEAKKNFENNFFVIF